MHERDEPRPISTAEHRNRLQRARSISRLLGFVGNVEYRHVYSRSGGAQFGPGPSAAGDLLVLYAEGFERDANPHDFSLEALIAHECGHQRLLRNRELRTILAKLPGDRFEEILASLIGSLLLGDSKSSRTLVWKATAELGDLGMTAAATVRFVERLRGLLRNFL